MKPIKTATISIMTLVLLTNATHSMASGVEPFAITPKMQAIQATQQNVTQTLSYEESTHNNTFAARVNARSMAHPSTPSVEDSGLNYFTAKARLSMSKTKDFSFFK